MNGENREECIKLCNACAIACNNCASACLKEENVSRQARCINLDLQCAAICNASVQIMVLDSAIIHDICGVCVKACLACAEECEKHVHMNHCVKCAEVCRACAVACEKMLMAA